MDLAQVADLWEENQEFLKQRLGQSDSTLLGACWVLMPQVPVPKFNHVSRVRVERGEVDRLVAEAHGFFRRRGLPAYCIMTTPATRPAELAGELEGLGFTCETNPVMIWDGTPVDHPNPEVRVEMAPREQAPLVFQTIRRIFFPDASDPAAQVLREGVEIHYDIGALQYLAHLGGTLAGIGSLFVRGGMGGIYNMGTLPHARGRGVATAIMAVMIQEARRLGCKQIGLTPTTMGRPLYDRLGFKVAYLERYYARRYFV